MQIKKTKNRISYKIKENTRINDMFPDLKYCLSESRQPFSLKKYLLNKLRIREKEKKGFKFANINFFS